MAVRSDLTISKIESIVLKSDDHADCLKERKSFEDNCLAEKLRMKATNSLKANGSRETLFERVNCLENKSRGS